MIKRTCCRGLLVLIVVVGGTCPGAAGAADADPVSQAATWVGRFAFQPPQASAEGVCVPQAGGLPTFVVTPKATGQQLVRASLPFAPGTFPADASLSVVVDGHEIAPDVQVLTCHPGRPRCVRRAIVTFVYAFADAGPRTFSLALKPGQLPSSAPTSRPGAFEARVGQMDIKVNADSVEMTRGGKVAWRAELVAPRRSWSIEPTSEVIAAGANYLWARLLVPDERWPRIIEVRADVLGTVAIRAHVQRMEPTTGVIGRAPDLGWRIIGPAADREMEHSFAQGQPVSVAAGEMRVDFPDAHWLLRGGLTVRNGNAGSEVVYLRCRASEQVPQQYGAWRTATAVFGPARCGPWTSLLEPAHAVRIGTQSFDAIYHCGREMDLSAWKLLEEVRRYHLEAIASSSPKGDDFGNVTGMPTSGVYGMNRLNHCPPIIEEYYRIGDERLRDVALHWCENYHDLTIWWGTTGTTRFGGTRYNNASAHGDQPADPNFMWRSNTSVTFCTKGCDTFFYAYEETGDPRMATALRWQMDYACDSVHCDQHECRNIGDVMDFLRMYRFTGERRYWDEAMRLFRELRTKLSDGDLFSQGGAPIEKDPPFIDSDEDGYKHPFAKPYIIGYALSGLPRLAGYDPDEPKLQDVIRAVARFMADSQDPAGGWRYPHPRSSGTTFAQAVEHAMQISRAAAFLESRGEPIDHLLNAIERVLQQRVLTWAKTGQILGGLGGWEAATGMLKDGKKKVTDLYHRPEDRDRTRDYTEGGVSVGGAPPEGIVYFFEVLDFYLAHRPAERLFHADAELQKVLARVPAGSGGYREPEPARDYPRFGVVDQLPTFREQLLGRLTFPMAWNPGSGEDFDAWRSRARSKVLECLQAPPPRADFAPVVIAREDRGTYEARKLVFNVSADCRVPAYLLVPKGSGPFPAVVALHDHGAFFLIGKEKMIRPFDDRPEIIAAADDWVKKSYGGRFVGDALAQHGYVVFSADALYWGDRGRKEGADHSMQQAVAANLMQMGTTWLGINTSDDIRAAEFVASLPEVDPTRIGAIGLSMGSHRTWMLNALSDRITAAVAVCWMCTTDALMTPGNNQTKGQSAYTMLPPGLRNDLDYPDVASIACPKPLMVFDGGEKDKLFPVAGVDAAYARMHKVYDSRGVGDRLVTKRWDVGHVFNVEMQDEAITWLDRWLKQPSILAK